MYDLNKYSEYSDYPVHFARLEWIFNLILHDSEVKNKKILDVGCGTGNVTIPLGLIPDSDTMGIDMHQGNLDISVSRNVFPNVKFKFEYYQDGDIKDYDYIIFTEVLEHIPNYREIFEHTQKSAKSSMKLLITIPNGRGPFEICMQPLYLMRRMGMDKFIWKVKNLLGKKEPYSQNYDTPHVNFFTVCRLKKELAEYGMYIHQQKNAFILAPVFETYLPFLPLKTIARIDNFFAGILPRFFASGWYFDIRFKEKQ